MFQRVGIWGADGGLHDRVLIATATCMCNAVVTRFRGDLPDLSNVALEWGFPHWDSHYRHFHQGHVRNEGNVQLKTIIYSGRSTRAFPSCSLANSPFHYTIFKESIVETSVITVTYITYTCYFYVFYTFRKRHDGCVKKCFSSQTSGFKSSTESRADLEISVLNTLRSLGTK